MSTTTPTRLRSKEMYGSAKEHRAAADAWNAAHPIGSLVELLDEDGGLCRRVKTADAARIGPNGFPVVALEGDRYPTQLRLVRAL